MYRQERRAGKGRRRRRSSLEPVAVAQDEGAVRDAATIDDGAVARAVAESDERVSGVAHGRGEAGVERRGERRSELVVGPGRPAEDDGAVDGDDEGLLPSFWCACEEACALSWCPGRVQGGRELLEVMRTREGVGGLGRVWE